MCRYGAQHPIVIHHTASGQQWKVPVSPAELPVEDYVVVGHCCESGDLFTCAPGDGDRLQPRTLAQARIGDLVTVEGVGAYCSSMSTKNYNSFPESPEVFIDMSGNDHLIRK